MKKMLLVLMLVVLSSFAFAARGDHGEGEDFFALYNDTHTAVYREDMHKDIGLEKDEIQIVKDIINKGWYEMKMLEADKLKEVFAVDALLIDGPGNKSKIDKHFDNMRKIQDKMEKIYTDTDKELAKHVDLSKMK